MRETRALGDEHIAAWESAPHRFHLPQECRMGGWVMGAGHPRKRRLHCPYICVPFYSWGGRTLRRRPCEGHLGKPPHHSWDKPRWQGTAQANLPQPPLPAPCKLFWDHGGGWGRVEGAHPLPRMHRGFLAGDQGQGEGPNHGQGYLERPVSRWHF